MRYSGANDVLTLLNDRISPGAIVLFDELVNYPAYRDHEMKALWEWLGRTGRVLEVRRKESLVLTRSPFEVDGLRRQHRGTTPSIEHRSQKDLKRSTLL